MSLKEIPFLLWYSLKGLFHDLGDYLSEFKRAKTWSFIFFAVLIYAVYTKNAKLLYFSIPAILFLYVVRQRKEPKYNVEIRDRAVLSNDEQKLVGYYRTYKRSCLYRKKEPLSYEEWYAYELELVKDKKYNDLDHESNEL